MTAQGAQTLKELIKRWVLFLKSTACSVLDAKGLYHVICSHHKRMLLWPPEYRLPTPPLLNGSCIRRGQEFKPGER